MSVGSTDVCRVFDRTSSHNKHDSERFKWRFLLTFDLQPSRLSDVGEKWEDESIGGYSEVKPRWPELQVAPPKYLIVLLALLLWS